MSLLAIVLGLSLARADWPAEDLWFKCKSCHGPDGKANTRIGVKEKIPDFTSEKWQAERSDTYLREIITNGAKKDGSKMKGFKEKFTPSEIESLIPYVRAMKGK
jgi:mono/diheme cytochrome c family protein